MEQFLGCHSEWNLGSPGGWDYQRITQIIGKAVWERLNRVRSIGVDLDLDHPLLYPVFGFVEMLVETHRSRAGSNQGFIAVVAEEETLEDVTENINLVERLGAIDGISSALMAPQDIEISRGQVAWRGDPISLIFMDFNTDVLLDLHRRHGLAPLIRAVREGRVINPRGTEPINVKSMFEVINRSRSGQFQPETVRRTPWTRRFFPRQTQGPDGEEIRDLLEWTRGNWGRLVLKPERGYSGFGVRVGGVNEDGDEAIGLAIKEGSYIVQERIPLNLWAEDNPTLNVGERKLVLERYQTDFRCLMGPTGMYGFLGRFGGVPTNVGSGGGVQPLGVLRSRMSVRDAVARINDAILEMDFADVADIVRMQGEMAMDNRFTYLLGPIRMALRPRVISPGHLEALGSYCSAVWKDCLTLERMWLSGELDDYIEMEEEELQIARSQKWQGGPAVFATDGLFSFGAHPEEP